MWDYPVSCKMYDSALAESLEYILILVGQKIENTHTKEKERKKKE